jgi:hypothetical protein
MLRAFSALVIGAVTFADPGLGTGCTQEPVSHPHIHCDAIRILAGHDAPAYQRSAAYVPKQALMAAKDQSQIAPEDDQEPKDTPLPIQPPPETESVPLDEMSLGEVPVIDIVELTPESARRGLDAFALVRERYAQSSIYQYESLEEFVEKTEEGKRFETDIKSFGFANIDEWNKVITTIGLAYSALTDSPTEDIEKQIAEIRADNSLAKDMKERMIKSLSAMVPTPNNRKVLEDLAKDAQYGEKLKLLAEEE